MWPDHNEGKHISCTQKAARTTWISLRPRFVLGILVTVHLVTLHHTVI